MRSRSLRAESSGVSDVTRNVFRSAGAAAPSPRGRSVALKNTRCHLLTPVKRETRRYIVVVARARARLTARSRPGSRKRESAVRSCVTRGNMEKNIHTFICVYFFRRESLSRSCESARSRGTRFAHDVRSFLIKSTAAYSRTARTVICRQLNRNDYKAEREEEGKRTSYIDAPC